MGMKISKVSKFYGGFTLIELIVVIAILGTLAGIAYPAIMGFQENARISAANKTCVDIVAGVASFKEDHNGILPYYPNAAKPNRDDQIFLITEAKKDAGLISILTGYEDNEERLNINNEAYMKPTKVEAKQDGLFGDTADELSLYDPWGKPYYIVLCESLSGCIDPFTNKRYRNDNCMVYSTGPDKEGVARAHTGGKNAKRNARKAGGAKNTAAQDEEDALLDNVYSWKKNVRK